MSEQHRERLPEPVVLDAARDYVERGWKPLPVKSGNKGCVEKGWPTLEVTADNIREYFNRWTPGVCVQLGHASNGLCDVDLDCREALELVRNFDHFLPPTAAVFGRASKPRSHYLYVTKLSDDSSLGATVQFPDAQATDAAMLVELRVGAGDAGAATLFPPSEHPSGETVTWASAGRSDPAEVDGDDLHHRVKILAAAALLVRRYPASGARHEAMLVLGGVLARAGWSAEQIAQVVEAVATVAADEEVDDRVRAAKSAAEHLASGGDVAGLPRMRETWTSEVADQFAQWLELGGEGESLGPAKAKATKADNQTNRLIALAAEAELFHTAEGLSFADVFVHGHRETWPVASRNTQTGFGAWLRHRFFEATGGAPNPQSLTAALNTLAAKARYAGPVHEVYVRIAAVDDKVYLDLGDEEWRVIEIDSDDWRLVEEPAVRFLRRRGMKAIPVPVHMANVTARDRAIDKLFKYVNVASEEDFCLVVSWLLAALRGRGPFPVLVMLGEPGTAKSTLLELLKSLVDPNKALHRAPPREARDMFIAANNGYIVAYDNLSDLKDWLSDMLCRLSTGGGFSTRQLYTDDEEALFDAMRPVAMTAVDNVVLRSDLTDRSVFLTLRAIPDDKRRLKREIWTAFEKDRPVILGALLDIVAYGLRELPNTKLTEFPRMADFAEFATACEGAVWAEPGIFARAYSLNRAGATSSVIEEDLIANALAAFMSGREIWKGETKLLLKELNAAADDTVRESREWPKAPNALTRRMNRIAGMLRKIGIIITPAPTPGGASGWSIKNARPDRRHNDDEGED